MSAPQPPAPRQEATDPSGAVAGSRDPGRRIAQIRRSVLRALRRAAPALLMLALPLILLWPVTFGGQSMVPYDALRVDPAFKPALEDAGVEYTQNDLVADLVFQNLVWKEEWVGALRAGQVPLWSSGVAGGMPFFAAGQHSGLYPQTLLFLLLPTELAFGWNAALSLWLAALAMFALGRAMGLGRYAATFMGLAWSLSLLFVVNGVFPMVQSAMTWLPLILAGIWKLTQVEVAHRPGSLPRGKATLWLLLVAGATALCALAGHPEMLIYSALVAAFFSLYRLLGLRDSAPWRGILKIAVWLGAAAFSGALLAAVQLLPLAELASSNWRSGAASYQEVVAQAFGIRQAITFLLPDFYGNPAHHAVLGLGGGGETALADHAMWGVAWGTRNYVEAAAYVGLMVMLLVPVGLVAGRLAGRIGGAARFFGGLALVSLSFIFGLPSYRLLFFGIPGVDQLRTPFRWIFPLVLALVIMAGIGIDQLEAVEEGVSPSDRAGRRPRRLAAGIGAVAIAMGSLMGLMTLLAWARPGRWNTLVANFLERLPCPDGNCARDAALQYFPDLASLAAYEFWNFAHLAAFLTLSGIALFWLARAGDRTKVWAKAMVQAVLILDLGLIGFGFSPAVDPALADLEPPAVAQLSELVDAKWGRVTGFGSQKTLWPNTAMRYGIPDLRAYDSILPWWTVETLDAIEDQDGMLIYNRIGNLLSVDSLASPALAALGARYILSSDPIDAPGLSLVFGGEDGSGDPGGSGLIEGGTDAAGETRIYENLRAMPRAWVVEEVAVYEDRDELLDALTNFDPAKTALLEVLPDADLWDLLPAGRPIRAATRVRPDLSVSPNELVIDVGDAPSGGMLMISEAWFPGWRAWIDTAGEDEVEVPVFRADGMLRAVPVPPGRSTVRLKYFPMSVKIGLYGSFLGGILLILALAYALWDRFVRIDETDELGRVALNSAGPIAANLLNKLVLFVFAMLTLRVLGPRDAGQYYVAVTIIGFADIFTNFGLNLLTTREVARRPERASEYLSQTIILRLLLWLIMLPLMAGYIALRASGGATNPLSQETVLAIGLFAIALVPSNLNTAISSIFQARERMTLPAAVTIISTLITVSVGAMVLLGGYGFVGLAAVSILTNWITFGVFLVLARRHGIHLERRIRPALIWSMVALSLPLMLNHLLQTVFFKIDVLLLDQLLPRDGATVVGWYQAAYKWVDALLILPAFFTMALFPLLSRRASDDPAGFRRAFTTAQRWLITVALPIAVFTTFAADTLVWVLAGSDYVPQGGTALKIMIWFLPLSFANGLTQYVLIALDRQRWITLSFLIATLFNLGANWLVIPGHVLFGVTIPAYTYVGAAVVTILSELVLRLPFGWGLRDVGAPPLLVLLWRPALAASAAAAVLALGEVMAWPAWFTLALAMPSYALVLVFVGGVTADDRAILARLLPGGRGKAVSEADAPMI
jgi:O-antigen/teichoic acid export membrane protein